MADYALYASDRTKVEIKRSAKFHRNDIFIDGALRAQPVIWAYPAGDHEEYAKALIDWQEAR